MKNSLREKFQQLLEKLGFGAPKQVEKQKIYIASEFLDRQVRVDVFLPPGYFFRNKSYPLLLFNDGQDLGAAGLQRTLTRLYENRRIHSIIVAGIYAGDRKEEYGTIAMPDYEGRGGRARLYEQFVLEELLPELSLHFRLRIPQRKFGFAGFSLGGLSAFDLVWNNPEIFDVCGVFSGSFWWRYKPEEASSDPDAHRIMHEVLRHSSKREGLRFWLQTGTLDEEEDRNENGIIDSIDDTLDIIEELLELGYERDRDIRYIEVVGGRHNQQTWGKVLPDFLIWAYGKRR